MDWELLKQGLMGVGEFFSSVHDTQECNFDFEVEGVGLVGVGRIEAHEMGEEMCADGEGVLVEVVEGDEQEEEARWAFF